MPNAPIAPTFCLQFTGKDGHEHGFPLTHLLAMRLRPPSPDGTREETVELFFTSKAVVVTGKGLQRVARICQAESQSSSDSKEATPRGKIEIKGYIGDEQQ